MQDQIYWTDWTLNAVMVANKHSGAGISKFLQDLPGIMDLKVLHRTSQQGLQTIECIGLSCRFVLRTFQQGLGTIECIGLSCWFVLRTSQQGLKNIECIGLSSGPPS